MTPSTQTPSRSLHVWVPHEEGPDLLRGLPDEIVVSLWPGTGEQPGDADLVRVVVIPQWPVPGMREALEPLPNLELVQATTTGVDHIRQSVPGGVGLAALTGLHGPMTSEWVVSLMIASLGGFVGSEQRPNYEWGPMRDTLDRKRVTIVGYGDIGSGVERRLAGFDVDITRVASRRRDGVHGVDELDSLLPDTDILVLIAPLSERTRGLISRDRLAALPDGALVVNAARGGIVDQDALFAELRGGRLRAALDAVDPDPLPPGHELRSTPNLVYSPHIGGWNRHTVPLTYEAIASQLKRVHQGLQPEGVV